MNIEKRLDTILDILYDENLLHWNGIDATNFIAFANKKYGLDWSDVEMNFILTLLQDDEYIVLNKTTTASMKMPTFSLTTKGVQMKRKGGFTKSKFTNDVKSFIILWGTVVGLTVGLMSFVDLTIKFYGMWTNTEKAEQVTTTCCNKKCEPNQKEENRDDNQSVNETSLEVEIIKGDSVSKSIEKHSIGTTK